MPAETPREFFNEFLKPAVEEWRRDKLSRHKAINALTQVDVMAERMFRHLQKHDPARLAGNVDSTAYRQELCARHPALGLVWDARDTHKHAGRTEHTEVRLRTSATAQTYGFKQAVFGIGPQGGGEQMFLIEDTGREHQLELIFDQVLIAWERELSDAGL